MDIPKEDRYPGFSQPNRPSKQRKEDTQEPNSRLAFTSTLRYYMTFNHAPPESLLLNRQGLTKIETLSQPTLTDVRYLRQFDLVGLPVELRYEILWFLIREYTEHGSVNVANFETFPAIMRTSHQIFAEARRIWSRQPLYFPKPLGMNVTTVETRQANGIHAIYGATPPFLVMRVPVMFHFVYNTREERLAGFERVEEEYNLHPASPLLVGRPFGRLPPPAGNLMSVTFSSYKHWKFIPLLGPLFNGKVARATISNLLPMFAWWSLSRITAVGELLTIDLVGIKEWLTFNQELPFPIDFRGSTWRNCMGSVLAAIIAFSPNVPKIKITGLGACLNAFLALWESMPRDLRLWNGKNPIISRVVTWPYSEFVICYELLNDLSETGIKYRRCEGNRLGVREPISAWATKVWKARFERYEWEFAA